LAKQNTVILLLHSIICSIAGDVEGMDNISMKERQAKVKSSDEYQ
jgi:hypothetical protein